MHRFVVPAVVLIAGFLGPFNPLDTVARGKFVRAFQTRKGEASATVCIPADTAQQVPGFLTDLPRVLRALEDAGARAVVFDVVPMPSASEGQTRLPVVADSGVTYSAVQASGSGAKVATPVSGVVIGADWQALPLAVAALGAHRALPASKTDGVLGALGTVDVGDQQWPVYGPMAFMPYEIPFLHWDKTETWEDVAGRTVFIGACRVDRELTRFGRQPGTVAHGELFETLRDGVVIRPLPIVYDVLVAMVTYLIAWSARSAMPERPRAAALTVTALAVGVVLALSLHGVWISLTGVIVAGVVLARGR